VEWAFSTFKSLTTTDERFSKELSEMKEVWDCLAKVFPLLRSTRLLKITERADLITYIEEFGELSTKNITKNPTPKIHSLFPHVEACLKKYGTVGVFAEDYLGHSCIGESHCCSIPVYLWGSPDKTGTSFFVGRMYSHHENLEEENGKKEEMIAQGKIVKVVKRKRQGTGAHEDFRVDHTLLDAIPEATQVLHD
jgi:hypothetical protein